MYKNYFEKRRAKMKQLSGKLNMTYREEEQYGMIHQLEGFLLFQKGYRKQIRNLMSLTEMNFKIHVFDYEYQNRLTKTANRRNQTVLFFQSLDLGLPEFFMRPETLLDAIATKFGREDIDFKEWPKFSRAYYLKGPDEDFIRHHFTDQVIRYFTSNRGWTIEAINFYLILYVPSKLIAENVIEEFMDVGLEVVNQMYDGTKQQN